MSLNTGKSFIESRTPRPPVERDTLQVLWVPLPSPGNITGRPSTPRPRAERRFPGDPTCAVLAGVLAPGCLALQGALPYALHRGWRVPGKPGRGWAAMGQHKPPDGGCVNSSLSPRSWRERCRPETSGCGVNGRLLLQKPLGNVETQVAGGSHRVPGGVTATSSERWFFLFFSFFRFLVEIRCEERVYGVCLRWQGGREGAGWPTALVSVTAVVRGQLHTRPQKPKLGLLF